MGIENDLGQAAALAQMAFTVAVCNRIGQDHFYVLGDAYREEFEQYVPVEIYLTEGEAFCGLLEAQGRRKDRDSYYREYYYDRFEGDDAEERMRAAIEKWEISDVLKVVNPQNKFEEVWRQALALLEQQGEDVDMLLLQAAKALGKDSGDG